MKLGVDAWVAEYDTYTVIVVRTAGLSILPDRRPLPIPARLRVVGMDAGSSVSDPDMEVEVEVLDINDDEARGAAPEHRPAGCAGPDSAAVERDCSHKTIKVI